MQMKGLGPRRTPLYLPKPRIPFRYIHVYIYIQLTHCIGSIVKGGRQWEEAEAEGGGGCIVKFGMAGHQPWLTPFFASVTG